jgi:hypothetical protein
MLGSRICIVGLDSRLHIKIRCVCQFSSQLIENFLYHKLSCFLCCDSKLFSFSFTLFSIFSCLEYII